MRFRLNVRNRLGLSHYLKTRNSPCYGPPAALLSMCSSLYVSSFVTLALGGHMNSFGLKDTQTFSLLVHQQQPSLPRKFIFQSAHISLHLGTGPLWNRQWMQLRCLAELRSEFYFAMARLAQHHIQLRVILLRSDHFVSSLGLSHPFGFNCIFSFVCLKTEPAAARVSCILEVIILVVLEKKSEKLPNTVCSAGQPLSMSSWSTDVTGCPAVRF